MNMEYYKVSFKEFDKEADGNRRKAISGSCTGRNRNHRGEIEIFKNSEDKLRTLVHETIHNYLFEKGRLSRVLEKLNKDEKFVHEISGMIAKNIKENIEVLGDSQIKPKTK